jgi:acetylcholinesterase
VKDLISRKCKEDEANTLSPVLQYTDWEHLGDGYINQKKIAEIVGDYFFICPTNLFAEKFAEQGTTVYYYYFTQVRPVLRLSLSDVTPQIAVSMFRANSLMVYPSNELNNAF